MLEAISNHILFEFVDRIQGKEIYDRTASGIIIAGTSTGDQNKDRWGHVLAVGPEVTDVKVGEYILIARLKWTNGVEVEGKTYWKTDINQVLAASEEYPYQ